MAKLTARPKVIFKQTIRSLVKTLRGLAKLYYLAGRLQHHLDSPTSQLVALEEMEEKISFFKTLI